MPCAQADASQAASSAPAAEVDASEPASSAAAEGSGSANQSTLSDAALKKAVTTFFDGEPGVQILAGKTLRDQAGAAGALVKGLKIAPKKCNAAQGIDIGSELKKNNIAIGVYVNPENPMQTITLTALSAGDPAPTQAKFDRGLDSLDGLQVQLQVQGKEADQELLRGITDEAQKVLDQMKFS